MPVSRPDALIAGRYRLVGRIADGGMGSVWEAWDEKLHRRVALKQLHPQPGLSAAEADLVSQRAMREARNTARLHHPHAIPVYDVVDYEGLPCLIMQYLPSKSLQALIAERGPLEVGEVARIGSEIAAALAAAHKAGIVHRDVKPGNVLIDEDGAAKLTDFGISHALGDATLTSTGMVTGTPAFLAPEVARGVASSAASDVFSLGSTLYAALEGSPPFGSDTNPMGMLHAVATGQIIPPERSGALTPALKRMLTADPAARPPMEEVARELSTVDAAPETSDATTQRIPVPAPVPPPSATVSLPAQSPAPPVRTAPPVRRPERRRWSGTAIAVAAVIAFIGLAFLVGTQLLGQDSGGGGNTQAAGPSSSPSTTRSTSRSASPPPSTRASSSASRSTSASPSASSSRSTSGVAAGVPTRAQLVQAITDYYALLPDNTDAGWQLLTARYQRETSKGRANYEDFWGGIDSVSVSNVTANPPGTVVATVNYVRNGQVDPERTSFQLVRQGGVLKIDASTVLGSG